MRSIKLIISLCFLFILISCAKAPKENQTISFKNSSETITIAFDQESYTNIATGGKGKGSISYSSNHPNIATVDPITGEVRFVKVGLSTITATKAEDSRYFEASTSYIISIIEPEVQESSKEVKPVLLSSTYPADDEIHVSLGTTIEFAFFNAVAKTSVNKNSFTVSDSAGNIDGDIRVLQNRVTFVPKQPLSGLTKYTVNLQDQVSDVAGNKLGEIVSWAFRTKIDETKWYNLTTRASNNYQLKIDDTNRNCLMTNSEELEIREIQWRFNSVYNSEGYYFIQSASGGNNKALLGDKLDVTCSMQEIDNVQNPDPTFLWQIVPTENGYFKLHNRRWGNQLALDTTNGAAPSFVDTNFSDSQLWRIRESANLSNKQLTKSIIHAVWNFNTPTYQFVEKPGIQIQNAPIDLDWKRWAMFNDGDQTKILFFKRNTDNKLYSFTLNETKTIFYFDAEADEIKIENVPTDANTNSFAMLHNGDSVELYMQSKTQQGLYQFVSNSENSGFIYEQSTMLKIYGAPEDSDWHRWAMLHDGLYSRFYLFKQDATDTFYQFSRDNGSQSFEFGSSNGGGTFYLEKIPKGSNTSQFGMFYTGNTYQLYLLTN